MPSPTTINYILPSDSNTDSNIADDTMRSLSEPRLVDADNVIDDDRDDVTVADDDAEQTRSLPDIVTASTADDFEDAIRSLPTTLSLSVSSDTPGAAVPGAAAAATSWNVYDEEDVTRSIDLVRLNDDTTYFGSSTPVWVSSPYTGQCPNTDSDAPLRSKAFGLSLTYNSVVACHSAAYYTKERSDTDSEAEARDDSREPGAEGSSDEYDDGETHAQSTPPSTTPNALPTASTASQTSTAPSALYTTPAVPDEQTRSYDVPVSTSTRYATAGSSSGVGAETERRQPVLCRTQSVVLDDDDDSRVFRSIQHASRRSMNEEYTRTRKQIQQRIDRALAVHQTSH